MSEEYLFEKDVSNDKKLGKDLRQKINRWANAKPHHPYKNLGDKITIESIWYKPAYPIEVLSQYESRSRHKGFEPYTSQQIPERKLFSLDDFVSWDIPLSEVQQFINETTKNTVPHSQYVEDCFKCNAKGWITCPQCSGSCKITCPKCKGSGKNTCGSCGGSGSHRCNSCSGSGRISRTVTRYRQETQYNSDGSSRIISVPYSETVYDSCSRCGGRGKNTCSTCSGSGKVTCDKCSGRGKINCPTCAAAGRITCPICAGHKRLMHYFYVERELEYTKKKTCVIHFNVHENYPEYLDNYGDYETIHLKTFSADKLQTGQLGNDHHLNPFIDEFLTEAHNYASNSNVMLFQRLDVSRIDTWELNYSFKGKQYKMVFTGSSYEIIPGLSPIYEVAFSYWDKAVSASKLYRLRRAHRLLQQAAKINVYELQDDVIYALRRVRKKINEAYSFGALLGALLASFFGGFFAYAYFNEVNYVLDYAGFINREGARLYPYHAWTMTGTYIFLVWYAFFQARKWLSGRKTFIPGALIRALVGALVTIVASAILLGFLGALNITGITILLTFLVWLGKWILIVVWYALTLVIGLIILLIQAIWWIIKWIAGLFI